MKKLLKRYSPDGNERVGFILKTGRVVEVPNVSAEPRYSFDVAVEDIEKYAENAVATWHTHPGSPANLSSDDFTTYLNWPNLDHFVIGSDGVRKFVVVNGKVING